MQRIICTTKNESMFLCIYFVSFCFVFTFFHLIILLVKREVEGERERERESWVIRELWWIFKELEEEKP